MCHSGAKCAPMHTVALVLVVVGALNWGLVGAFDFNLVSLLIGKWPMFEKVVYILVGLAAIMTAVKPFCKCHKESCEGGSCCSTGKK
ncbi:MAG: DUF378 domain-containing protein [bacterium]|nr:DUF378 domain-containing protein [bacterium]